MNCETCVFYVYDEQTEEYICVTDMDEDEFAALSFRDFKGCPFYRKDDEYGVVRHQN